MASIKITLNEPITLLEAYMRLAGITRSAMADAVGVHRNKIQAIAEGEAASAELALAIEGRYGIPLRCLIAPEVRSDWSLDFPDAWTQPQRQHNAA